ncbi:probable pectinesterase/pectinesterase inhibitor 36 [Tripterygium wilfordii]|uniref:probable pectinesterase/pectinesterase inhibitor 36 n=1 Tax=Tripterygium wilfordii TaxID=458696 RepID=UPI0018F83FE0|nr:probable pectinesterase/pectinesterase inhibitor 36 [Tripterygium wilfordii]
MTTFLLLLLLAAAASTTLALQEMEAIEAARRLTLDSKSWVQFYATKLLRDSDQNVQVGVALSDCARFYDENEYMLGTLLAEGDYTSDDARTWLSGVLANHRTCLDGLGERGFGQWFAGAKNLTLLLGEALALYNAKGRGQRRVPRRANQNSGFLTSWNPSTSRANFIVAKDGSGTHNTIKDAVVAVAGMGKMRSQRVIIYVKAGVYNEKVELDKHTTNIMLVGDGIDRTIVTGNRNYVDGASTTNSATFGVSGNGFWARDITFENTAGPQKHQAVALRVSSDHAVFYRCSFKGYQDTLFVLSQRQFYRDCHIYGTIDFIFGNAQVVFQNCDIFVRRPMGHQSNMITAQGREIADENTGILIQESRVRPALEFVAVKNSFRSYLGRPWKKYSRTVFMKTDLDGLIDPRGWIEWDDESALSTLFYAEYMNTGAGGSTAGRVRWPGYHVLRSTQEASPFTVEGFMQGNLWIPQTGVPFNQGI